MDFGFLTELFSSAGFGAVTGGFFGWLNRREDRKNQAQQQSFELDRIKTQSTSDIKLKDAEGFADSQKTISKVGDAIKSAVRPIVTGFLMYLTWDIYSDLSIKLDGLEALPVKEMITLYHQIVLNIIALTAMAISWWFASRPPKLNGLK
jgi:hypothetical protein